MGAANSSGGVMGKMIDAQSIVVASTATQLGWPRGHHPALRVLAFDRAGLPGRHFGHAAGLRLSVHGDGAEIVPCRDLTMIPRRVPRDFLCGNR